MIKTEKDVKITISGEDVKTLNNMCKVTIRYLMTNMLAETEPKCVDEFTLKECVEMKDFINEMFEA